MDKKVTMNTKGITQDESGDYGIWRTIKRIGRVFIKVGETGNDAVARKTKEWLEMPSEKLKKHAQKPYNATLQSKVYDKISTIRKDLEEHGEKTVFIYSFEYRYRVLIRKDYSYKILTRKKLK
jgi:hypothetical protein